MNKFKISKKDIKAGIKRLNLSLTIDDYESLILVAEYKGIAMPGTMALSILLPEIRKISAVLRKNDLIPGQTKLKLSERKRKK